MRRRRPKSQSQSRNPRSRTSQLLSAAFVGQDGPEAAWVAADRAIRAAEQSGQPLQAFAGIFRLAQAFVRLKHLDQAEHAASTAVNALRRYTEGENPNAE